MDRAGSAAGDSDGSNVESGGTEQARAELQPLVASPRNGADGAREREWFASSAAARARTGLFDRRGFGDNGGGGGGFIWRRLRAVCSIFFYYVIVYPALSLATLIGLVGGFIGGILLQLHAIKLAGNLWLAVLALPYALGVYGLVQLGGNQLRARRGGGDGDGGVWRAMASSSHASRLLVSLSVLGSFAYTLLLVATQRVPVNAGGASLFGTLCVAASTTLWAFVLENEYLAPRAWTGGASDGPASPPPPPRYRRYTDEREPGV